jgi:thioredoxin-related protein
MGLLALVVGGTTGAEEALRDAETHFFDQTLGDLRDELQTAREEGKFGVLLVFEMEECPFCQRMKTQVLNRPRVQDYYREHFQIIPIDVNGDIIIQDFQGEDIREKDFAFKVNRVRATPVFLFYDANGKPVARYTGATTGIEEFLLLGEYVVEGIYKDMPFTRYKRQKPIPANK